MRNIRRCRKSRWFKENKCPVLFSRTSFRRVVWPPSLVKRRHTPWVWPHCSQELCCVHLHFDRRPQDDLQESPAQYFVLELFLLGLRFSWWRYFSCQWFLLQLSWIYIPWATQSSKNLDPIKTNRDATMNRLLISCHMLFKFWKSLLSCNICLKFWKFGPAEAAATILIKLVIFTDFKIVRFASVFVSWQVDKAMWLVSCGCWGLQSTQNDYYQWSDTMFDSNIVSDHW